MKYFHIISLFPESIDSYIKTSIINRAQMDNLINIIKYNPRDYIDTPINKKKVVDDKPFGGGVGMIIKAEPIIKIIDKIFEKYNLDEKKTLIVFFGPRTRKFNTKLAKKYANDYKHIILLCGRYEGIDARVKEIYKMIDISIGDYVLTGGELPALVLIDSISRQIKGVLGKNDSLEENRNSSHLVYTRPAKFSHKNKEYSVPDVLLNGNHAEIEKWRKNNH